MKERFRDVIRNLLVENSALKVRIVELEKNADENAVKSSDGKAKIETLEGKIRQYEVSLN